MNDSLSTTTEETPPEYTPTLNISRRQRYQVDEIPPFQGESDLPTYIENQSPPRYLRQNYHVPEIPPFRGNTQPQIPFPAPYQGHPDFPFHLAPNSYMYLQFHLKDRNTVLIFPSGAISEDRPLYTIKRRVTQNIPRRYDLDLYRNHDRRADHYDPKTPVASVHVHKKREFLDLTRVWPDDTKTPLDGFIRNDMRRCVWRFPCASWSAKRPDCKVSSRLYARLCRVEDESQVIDERRPSVMDVLIWDGNEGLCHGQSFVRIAMREILVEGLQKETQMQRVDEIVMVAMRFCAGRIRFASKARTNC